METSSRSVAVAPLLASAFGASLLWKYWHRQQPTQQPCVLIRDPAAVAAKRDSFMASGAQRLQVRRLPRWRLPLLSVPTDAHLFPHVFFRAMQVISDFDRTLSSGASQTCHGCIESSSIFGPEYKAETAAMLAHYHPIELSPTLPVSEKIPFMVEWWTRANNLFLQYGLRREHIEECVRNSQLVLRAGVDALFARLGQKNVPLSIMSAGLTDIIEEVLQQRKLSSSKVAVFSNKMNFDAEGRLLTFDDAVIHTFNKNAHGIVASEFWGAHNMAARDKVIVMGDSLGDLDMSRGLPAHFEILSVGFLIHKNEADYQARLPQYLQRFDVVITHDASVDYVLDLLSRIQ